MARDLPRLPSCLPQRMPGIDRAGRIDRAGTGIGPLRGSEPPDWAIPTEATCPVARRARPDALHGRDRRRTSPWLAYARLRADAGCLFAAGAPGPDALRAPNPARLRRKRRPFIFGQRRGLPSGCRRVIRRPAPEPREAAQAGQLIRPSRV